jgi:hypothetical protein
MAQAIPGPQVEIAQTPGPQMAQMAQMTQMADDTDETAVAMARVVTACWR